MSELQSLVKKVSMRTTILGIGMAAYICFLPHASADNSNEFAFLGALNNSGVPIVDEHLTLRLGYLVCAGHTSGRLDDHRLVSLLGEASWGNTEKWTFIQVAKTHLCPVGR